MFKWIYRFFARLFLKKRKIDVETLRMAIYTQKFFDSHPRRISSGRYIDVLRSQES